MRRDKLTVVAVALVSLIVFVFLGAVSLESATSLSTVNQQGILTSLLAKVDSSPDPGRAWREEAGAGGSSDHDPFSAFILNQAGNIEFLNTDRPNPAQLALADHIMANPGLEPHQMVFDAKGTSFVWVAAPDAGPQGRLFLAYQRPDDLWLTRFKLYFVPGVIAALVVVWVSVWSGLIARRAFLASEKQKELELEVFRQEEASRVKSAFLANMNHELRTPLNAILGFSQMMQMQLLGPIGNAKYSEYVGNIIAASTHLRKLIGNILDISKIEAGEEILEEERVCPNDVVTECLSMTEKEIEAKGQTVIVNQSEGTPCIFADRLKIRQILLNLLTNANKFTPDGGTITVTVDMEDGGGLQVTVTDTGKGISPEELETVLQPFKRSQDRADRAKDGFGLGLPLSSALAELHGARFELDSAVGLGTTARLVFPVERLMPETAMTGVKVSA